MNHFHAKAECVNGVWRAFVRYSHKSDYWPVMEGNEPAAFPSMKDAEIAALREQERHINTTITGFGERADAARAKAETLFRPGKRPLIVMPGKAVRA